MAVTAVNFFLKRHRKYRYLIFAAGVFSALSLACLLVIRNYMLYCLVVHFFLNTGMVFSCFGKCGKKEFLENWTVTYLVIILLGGVVEWLNGSGLIGRGFLLPACLGAVIVYGALLYFMHRKTFGNHIVRVQISKDERQMELAAYFDSGNQLMDPYTGQGICILSYAKAQEFLNDKKDRIRFVPYRSLGENTGLLRVTDVDELILYDKGRCLRLAHMAVGIANPGLLEDKEYDLILHASLL